MTTLSTTDLASLIGTISGKEPVRYATKSKALEKIRTVLADVAGEIAGGKAADEILTAASFEAAEEIAFRVKAEANRDARVTAAREAAVSPGLARLRANPKAEEIRAKTALEAAAVLEERDTAHAVKAAPVAAPKPAKAAKAEAPAKTARVRPAATGVISSVAPNPKKPGSRAFKVFEVYRVGQTVAEFIAACDKAGIDEKEAKANLSWDRRKYFITISEAVDAAA